MLGWTRKGWVGVLCAVAACRPEPGNFDATCEVDEDCELVIDVGWCGQCSGVAALSERGAKRYENALALAVPMCGGILLIGCSDPVVDTQSAVCVDAQCRVEP